MFKNKKERLFTVTVENKSTASGSPFVKAAMGETSKTRSENGALKYDSTGDDFVDQFGVMGTYKKPRTFNQIEKDTELLWGANKMMTVAFILYLRMISRVTNVFGEKTSVPQKGGELKHEGIMRMIWLHTKAPKTFWKNITLFVSVGSWKDVITMLQYDLVYNGWKNRVLDWNKFGELILNGLEREDQRDLLKKYLPQIKAKSKCTTVEAQADNMIGKWICSLLFGNKEESTGSTYKKYRKLKTSGTAHEWQKLISQSKFNKIDFDKIHGRALNLLVRSKFLSNHGLSDKFESWVTDENTEVKYTGFVHELFAKLPRSLSNLDKNTETTINKQFKTLVDKAGEKRNTNLIVVRDTSSSMGSTATGTNMSCYNIGKALALYFSEFLTGKFADAWIEFNSSAKMCNWKGNTPLEKWYNDSSGYVGSTNFQSVIKLFCKLKTQGINESDFPSGILCISDSEFNPSALNKTNVDSAKSALRNAGFSNEYVNNFVIALWNLQSYGRGNKFETNGDVQNVFYFSGYSASTVSFLSNDIKTAKDLFIEAMNQEVLSMVEL